MQRRPNPKYLFLALLPLLIIAAVLWGTTSLKINSLPEKAPVSVSKVFSVQQHSIPLVSNDVPQFSRAGHRTSLQNWVLLAALLCVLSVSKTSNRHINALFTGSYTCLFKILFPAHEFS